MAARDFYRSGLQICERCGRKDFGAYYVDGRWICDWCRASHEHEQRRLATAHIPWWRKVWQWLRDQV